MKKLVVLLFSLLIFGCNAEEEVSAARANISEEQTWVFAQINVPEEGDVIETYYYYGKISQRLYDAIHSNEVQSGFILFQDVKYWGHDDIIHEYADVEYSGELIFRIEHIVKLTGINVEPIAGKGDEQFAEVSVEETVSESSDTATEEQTAN